MEPQLQSLDHLLKQFDLSDHQRKVFCTWIELGPVSIVMLAQATGIHRLTVHQTVAQLIAKWLFLETYSWKKRLVYPSDADGLLLLLEEQKWKVKQIEQQLESAQDIFNYMRAKRDTAPMTRLYRGIEGLNSITDPIRKDKKNRSIQDLFYQKHLEIIGM